MTVYSYTDVNPINRGYDSIIKIIYSVTMWAAYFNTSTRQRATFRLYAEEPTALVTADSSTNSVSLNAGERSVTISLTKAQTALFKGKTGIFYISSTLGGVETIVPGRWEWAIRVPITNPV